MNAYEAPADAALAVESPDVAALARRAGARAPVSAWQAARLLRSLWRLFGARPRALVVGVVASLARAVLLVLTSVAVGRLVGAGAPLTWGGMAAAGLLGAAVLGYVGQRVVIDSVQQGLGALRRSLVDKMLAQPVEAGASRSEAFVLALTRDGELLAQMARAAFAALLPAGVLTLLCLGGIAVVMPLLAGPLVLSLAALAWVRRGMARRLADEMARAHSAIDQLYAQLGGTALRQELAVSHGHEAAERQACAGAITRAQACTQALARTQAWATEADTLALGLSLLAVVAGLSQVGVGAAVSGAGLATVLFLLQALRSALQTGLRAHQDMAQGVPALSAIEALLALPGAAAPTGHVSPSRWHVQLQAVGCILGGQPVLRGVDLELSPGRLVVLTGANGAGKTTLLRLLLGTAEPTGGRMQVDGVPWAEIDRTAYRRGVGYLPQNAGLFAGTVYENVAYAAEGATPHQARQVLGMVGLGARLSRWPAGLDTCLGTGGSPLSGGERQRLALARVLMRQPRLLILDEPSNHLDAASVRALIPLLHRVPGQPAMLMVSHDPAIIAQADEVLLLVDGVLARP